MSRVCDCGGCSRKATRLAVIRGGRVSDRRALCGSELCERIMRQGAAGFDFTIEDLPAPTSLGWTLQRYEPGELAGALLEGEG